MNWRSPRLLLPVLGVLLVLSAGVLVMYLRNSTPSDISIVWQSTSTSFAQQDQQSIEAALRSALQASNSTDITDYRYTIIDAQRQGDWANFTANESMIQSGKLIATEPLFFLAHLQGSNWNVWLPGSSVFCNELKQTPGTLLDSIDKHYFIGCNQ